ncbi:MAG: alpha/beta fold hydrolase [Thermomicrobiales bacterium]|nr:alpha/beta fold hydrolase [Thermomicrobiales bacterium]
MTRVVRDALTRPTSRRSALAGAAAGALGLKIAADAAAHPVARAPRAVRQREETAMPLLSSNEMWETFGQRAFTTIPTGGADFGECMTTVQRVAPGDFDAWHREWTATADRVATIGDESAAKGHAVSAREAYLRASMYYHVSYFPLFGKPVDPRLVTAFERETETFQQAGALFDTPIEPVEIPFEGGSLPGYFIAVDDSGAPRPTVIHTDGYDSTIQEMYFASAPAAIRRGYNVLLFDGPGQGRPLIRDGMPMRPNWETVVTPVIDYALTRREIDPDNIVLSGWSFGGLLAPRAAGVEHRLAALIADPGQWDQRDAIMPILPLTDAQKAAFPNIDPALLEPMEEWLNGPEADPMMRWKLIQRGLWVHGVDTLFDYFVDFSRYEVSSVAGDITCPTLVTMAEGDPTAAGAPVLFAAIQAPKTLVHFTAAEGAGGHCETLARSLYHQRVFDWLDETLAG